MVGPDLSAVQFGFQVHYPEFKDRCFVGTLAWEADAEGGMLLVVSLDIASAFNILSFSCDREAFSAAIYNCIMVVIVESLII